MTFLIIASTLLLAALLILAFRSFVFFVYERGHLVGYEKGYSDGRMRIIYGEGWQCYDQKKNKK